MQLHHKCMYKTFLFLRVLLLQVHLRSWLLCYVFLSYHFLPLRQHQESLFTLNYLLGTTSQSRNPAQAVKATSRKLQAHNLFPFRSTRLSTCTSYTKTPHFSWSSQHLWCLIITPSSSSHSHHAAHKIIIKYFSYHNRPMNVNVSNYQLYFNMSSHL